MTRLGRPNAGLKARTTRTLRQPCFRPSRTAATFVLAVGVSPRLNANLERSRVAAISTWFPVEGRGFSRAKTCAWEIGLSAPALIPWLKPYRLRPWFAGLIGLWERLSRPAATVLRVRQPHAEAP